MSRFPIMPGAAVLTGTTFSSTNVGEPYAAFGNEVWRRENGHFRLSNMHRTLPELLIWANRRYENTMQIASMILPLYGFAGNTLIRIRVAKVPLVEYLYLSVTQKQGLIMSIRKGNSYGAGNHKRTYR